MRVRANDTTLYAELSGAGAPVLFVHGSWGDHHNWDQVVPEIAVTHLVVTYDRRGHSQSDRPTGQGCIQEDAADLAALIEELALGPVHLVGSSFGAAISLHLVADRPDLVNSLFLHEPPLIGTLAGRVDVEPVVEAFRARASAVIDLLEQGDMVGGARRFVEELAFGPGAWEQLPQAARGTFISNAVTWLDEMRQDDALDFDLGRLAGFESPTLLSQGDQSPSVFPLIVEQVAKAIPNAGRHTFVGAGHVPHLSCTGEYAATLRSFIERRSRLVTSGPIA